MNYHLMMKETLKNLDYKPKLLLHTCCGPCSTFVIDTLIKYFDITVYFYNPNIEPLYEYLKRKEEQKKFITSYKTNNVINFVDADYDNDLYKKSIKGYENEKEGGSRCSVCFDLRLDNTAKYASINNYDYFTTTLTVSPYKNSKLINELGNILENKYNIKYLYSDFKKENGYKRSVEMSKEFDLYRQEYCGCLFSKIEKENLS